MELEYTPVEDDLLALASHQVAISPAVRRRLNRSHLGYAVSLSLLAVGVYVMVQNEALSIGFAALATLALLAYPTFFRLRLHRSLPGLVRQRVTPSSYAARKLRALPDGLEQITDDAQSKVGWRLVDAVFETADYTSLMDAGRPHHRAAVHPQDHRIQCVEQHNCAAANPILHWR